MLIAGASAHGSPGVSTALQLVASLWSADAGVPTVVEADVTGGVLAARYELGLTPGFVTLAESLRKFEAPALLDHAQRLPSGVACVPLSPSATAADAQIRSAGSRLGAYLQECGHPVLLDAGTVTPDSKIVPAIASADLLLWFVRPTREELLVLRHRLAETAQPESSAVVLVGDKPYGRDQVAEALGVEVFHSLPIDRRGADAVNLGGDDRYLRRCQLTRSCAVLMSALMNRVGDRAGEAAPPPSVPAPGDTVRKNTAHREATTREAAAGVPVPPKLAPEQWTAGPSPSHDSPSVESSETVDVWRPDSEPEPPLAVWTPDR